MTGTFDPLQHRPYPQRGFSELEIGERFVLPSRTVTDAHFSAFQSLSGDNHPIHYDRPYCASQGHRDLLAHGLQVLCFTASGAGNFPHVIGESLIAFIELTARFKGAVYVNDTLYPCLTVIEKTPQRSTGVLTMSATVYNQDKQLVLDGEQKYLLKLD